MTELRPLTSARGIAAWFVVLYHIRFAIAGLPAPALAVIAKGYLAVDFFFLLSGLVIALTWTERLRGAKGFWGWPETRRFWWKRVARVYPLHLAMLGSGVALALLLAITGRAYPKAFPPAELPLHFLLLQNWGMTRELSWNTPAWSISAEACAYLLFPLFAVLVDWRRWPTVLVLAGIAALLLALHLFFASMGIPILGRQIPRTGLARCLLEFAAGTGVAALWQRWRDRPGFPAASAALFAAVGLGLSASHIVPETAAVPLAFAAALLALALTADHTRNPLGWAPLHYLGRISYATYLSHWLLFFAFKLALVRDPNAVPPGQIALYVVLVLVASVALHHLLELPAQRRLNRRPFLSRNDARPHALPGHANQNRLFG